MSSEYSLYVMLITNELFHVHSFLQRSYDVLVAKERARRRQDCQLVDEGLMAWRARFATLQTQYESEAGGHYDPNDTLIQCALDLCVLSFMVKGRF